MLREFTRVGIENGVMGMALPLLHKLDALRADFHSIDTCCGREWVRQALQLEDLVGQTPLQFVLGCLFHNKASLR